MIELKTSGIVADEAGLIWFITDIKAPAYWWYTFEHKILKGIGCQGLSLSMEPIAKNIEESEFKMSDFSCEFLGVVGTNNLKDTISDLNNQRWLYLKLKNPEYKKKYWYALMQSLPSGYNSCGKFRYSLGSAFIMLRALKPKILGNEYEFKEFADFFEYLENLVEGFSL